MLCCNMTDKQQIEQKQIVYCKHYKRLMVEDFSLNDNREDLHYGKCAVIGYCTFDRGVYFLGNIRITSSSPKFQLADNDEKVLLLTNLCSQTPPIGRFVEVLGESVLYDRTLDFSDDVASIPCTTSLDVYKTRCVFGEINGPVDDSYFQAVNFNYVPAIKVHGIVPKQNAHEIVDCNLRLRLIMDET